MSPWEVVLLVSVYHHAKPLKSQEFLVLGSQPLTALRDKIYCLSDHLFLSKTRQKKRSSGYFFIENTFYNDMRSDDAIDYGKAVIEWTAGNPKYPLFNISRSFSFTAFRFTAPYSAPLVSANMEDTTFGDLSIRIGSPYLYTHQGNCQHIITFTDLRLRNISDPDNALAYPLLVYLRLLIYPYHPLS